ncbi:hypothetical protein HF325_000094 [Metschnikowia pulcherrima]|uniref:Uncharacterized protein n=1 Tax=Metschnikowia pulcherrima TaxID=27326 RepID=A0A8H7GXB2_9ASCO|nr:hypothetical protein HF325_000094 [Metschnikowia pulcherrima]
MKSYMKHSALAFCVAAAVGASMVSDESPECSIKFYDTPPPVACSYQKNPYLNLPEEPSMVSEGKDGLSVEVPAASDGYVYELTGFYQATETREYSFSISESTVATMQLGFQSRDTREFHELISTEVHSLSYEKTTTFRMEKGETYPLRFAFCSDNGILPIYITEEGGETQEINTEIKQVSYEGRQEENGSGSSNKEEKVSDGGDSEGNVSEDGTKEEGVAQSDIGQEGAANNVSTASSSSEAEYYESEFYYTCYSAPKDEINKVSEETLTDVSELQVVLEGLSSEVETNSNTTRVDVPRVVEITGYCLAPSDGLYTIIMPSGLIASLQIGPATTTKEQLCTVSEEWRVLDTRLYAAAEFEFLREYYYPYRLVVLANEVDYRWDITQFDASGKEVDLLGIWNTASESCPIASPFSARTDGNDALSSNDTMRDTGMTGNLSETGSGAKPQTQGVSLKKTYAGFDCESFVSQRFVHTGGNGLGEEYIGTVADCSTRVGACTSVHAMTYAAIEYEELSSKTWTRVEENYEVVQASGGSRKESGGSGKGHASGPGAAGKTEDEEISTFSGFSDGQTDIKDGNMQGNSSSGPASSGNGTTLNGTNTTGFGNDTTLSGNKTITAGSTNVNQTDFQAYSGFAQDSSLDGSGTLTSGEEKKADGMSGTESTDGSHATATPGEESETKESSGESLDGKHGQSGKDSPGAKSGKDGHDSSSISSGHGAGSMNAGSGQRGSSGESSSSLQGGSSGHGGSARQGPAGNAGRAGQDAGSRAESGHGTASNGSSNRPNGSGSGSSVGESGPQASSTPNQGDAYGRKSGSGANGAPIGGSGASRGHDSPNRPVFPSDTSSGRDGKPRPGTATNSGFGDEKSNGGARGESTGAGKSPHDRAPKNGMPGLLSTASDGMTQGTTAPSSGDRPHKSGESGKPGDSNKPEKSEKPEKPAGSAESAKSDKFDKSDKSSNTDRPSPTGQPGQVGRNGEAGKDGGAGKPSAHDTGSRPGHGQAGEGSPSLGKDSGRDTAHGSANSTSSAGQAAPGSGSQGQGVSSKPGQSSGSGEQKTGPGDGKSGHHAGPDGKDKLGSHDGNSSVSGPGAQGRMGSDKNSTETSGSSNKTGPKGVPYSDDLRGSNSRGVEGSGKPTSGPEAPKTGNSPGRGSTAAILSTYDGAGAKSTSALSFVVGLCLVLLF